MKRELTQSSKGLNKKRSGRGPLIHHQNPDAEIEDTFFGQPGHPSFAALQRLNI
jgi:hypothetical protein